MASETAPSRSTDVVRCSRVVEGGASSFVGDKVLAGRWKKRYHFVVLSWAKVVHRPSSEAVLFSFPHWPIQEKFDLWREDRS